MTIKNRFNNTDEVYLITDPEQYKRLVVAITAEMSGAVGYTLRCGTEESYHYTEEISATRQVI